MDENEILAEIKNTRKISDMFPEYPCDKCHRGRGNCTIYRDCVAWRQWYHNRFVEVDEMFGVVRKRGKR
jgi:hypothetical protein